MGVEYLIFKPMKTENVQLFKTALYEKYLKQLNDLLSPLL
jgi:hypothetical protein